MSNSGDNKLSLERALAGIDCLLHDVDVPISILENRIHSLYEEGAFSCDALQELEILTARIRMHIGNCLTTKELSSNEVTFTREEIDLTQALKPIVISFQSRCKKAGIQFSHEGMDENINLDCNEEAIQRALWNILRNGLTAAESSMNLAIKKSANQCTIEVSDDGPGIPDGVAIFDYRESTGAGQGLGLFISKALIEAHGGAICHSRDSETRFLVTLPLYHAPMEML